MHAPTAEAISTMMPRTSDGFDACSAHGRTHLLEWSLLHTVARFPQLDGVGGVLATMTMER
jgi:hypothetical protein